MCRQQNTSSSQQNTTAEPDRPPVLVISAGGAVSNDINDAVRECAEDCGYALTGGEIEWRGYNRRRRRRERAEGNQPRNWLYGGGEKLIGNRWGCGRGRSTDTDRVLENIEHLVTRNGGDDFNGCLLAVGKSSGGVLMWNTFRLFHDEIRDMFPRYALVLVDPHGAVYHDDETGTYCDDQPLTWPQGWETDQSIFRVYHICQQTFPGCLGDFFRATERIAATLTGADFPDGNVFYSHRFGEDPRWREAEWYSADYVSGDVHQGRVDHMNITQHPITRSMIRRAFRFVLGEGDTGIRVRV